MDDKKGNACELFGLSETRANEISKAFRHAKIDADDWSECFRMAAEKAHIKEVPEAYYLGWLFRADYDREMSN